MSKPGKLTFTVWNRAGSHSRELVVSAVYEVCGRCDGHGQHDHPAFANGITSSEWHGPDWDDDSRDSYMRGVYDVPCERCKGARVELVPDESGLTSWQRSVLALHYEGRRRDDAERASEERWGY